MIRIPHRTRRRKPAPAWAAAAVIDKLTMFEPIEGDALSGRTTVRVLASSREIVVGIVADNAEGSGIVSYSKARQLGKKDAV